jgi:antitoxin component YwqK of YwqJK toxin-antitoxin module
VHDKDHGEEAAAHENVNHGILYHDNGAKRAEGPMVRGRRTGTWVHWDENGGKLAQGDYCDDVSVGRWRHWWANGAQASEGLFRNGVPIGHWMFFHASGKKRCQGVYMIENGRSLETGEWDFWNPDGSRDETRSGTYEKGKLVRRE